MSHLLCPVDTVDLGSVNDWSREATICAAFHNFNYLDTCTYIDSPTLQCHGHDWKIQIYKYGEKQVKAYLVNKGTKNVKVYFSTTICNETKTLSEAINVEPCKASDSLVFHYNNMEEILDSHGSLKVYMTIKIYQPLASSSILGKSSIWTPPKRILVNEMRQKLESGKDANIVFQVNGTLFPANKEIVMQGAHAFSDILEEDFAKATHDRAASNQQAKGNIENQVSIVPMNEVPIDEVDPCHFQLLLQFLYTDEVPLDLKNLDLETILQVANRFGCIRLKLLIEAEIVKYKVDANNAIDMLLFAEAQSCALLKEKALSVFAINPNEVMASAGWAHVEESIERLRELMKVLAPRTQKPKSSNNSLEHMSVAKLREELHSKDLDVDGTREMLVARLKKANNSSY